MNTVSFPLLDLTFEIDRVAFQIGELKVYFYGIIIAVGSPLGVCLEVYQQNLLAALLLEADHLQLPVRLMGVAHLRAIVLQAEAGATDMAILQYIMAHKIKILGLGRAGGDSDGLHILHSRQSIFRHDVDQLG